MITKLNIRNFQSHRDSQFEFSTGVNTIIGVTDSGKSAVLRAVRFCMLNRPLGDSFRSNWGGETQVTIETDSGDTVTRVKGDSVNEYQLNDQTFRAFKTEVPETIQTLLNINPEISFQSQHNPIFLLTQTPGEVANHFNRLAQIENIGRSIQFIQRETTRLKSEKEFTKKERDQLQEQLTRYEWIGPFEVEVDVLQDMESQVHATYGQIQTLLSLITKVNEIVSAENYLRKITILKNDLEVVESVKNSLKTEEEQINKIQQLLFQIQQAEQQARKSTKIIQLSTFLTKLEKLEKERKEMEEDKLTLWANVEDLKNQYTLCGKKKQDVDILSGELKTSMPDICPLCGNQIKKK